MHYIYEIKSSDDSDNHRYIGITNNPKRRFGRHKTEAKQNTKFYVYRWLNKVLNSDNSIIFTVLRSFPTLEEANYEEMKTIEVYKDSGFTMTNLTKGGDSLGAFNKGKKHSAEHRKKLADSRRGKPSAKKGIPLPKKLKDIQTKRLNDYIKENGSPVSKKIYQYSKEGELLKIWDSGASAGRVFYTNNPERISYIAKDERIYKNFVWARRELSVEDIEQIIINEATILSYRKPGANHKLAKPVYQYDIHGNFIKLWGSTNEVERNTSSFYSSRGVSNSCLTGHYYKDNFWSYAQRDRKEMINVLINIINFKK